MIPIGKDILYYGAVLLRITDFSQAFLMEWMGLFIVMNDMGNSGCFVPYPPYVMPSMR